MHFQICYNLEMEWRQIGDSKYDVSDEGLVRSRWFGEERPMRLTPYANGYLMVHLRINGKRTTRTVHSLVAEAFKIKDKLSGYEVNHINGNKHDNRAENLEYVSRSQNVVHAINVLGVKRARGEASGASKLTEIDVRNIRIELANGGTHRSVGSKHGVSFTTIRHIAIGKIWGWLK